MQRQVKIAWMTCAVVLVGAGIWLAGGFSTFKRATPLGAKGLRSEFDSTAQLNLRIRQLSESDEAAFLALTDNLDFANHPRAVLYKYIERLSQRPSPERVKRLERLTSHPDLDVQAHVQLGFVRLAQAEAEKLSLARDLLRRIKSLSEDE